MGLNVTDVTVVISLCQSAFRAVAAVYLETVIKGPSRNILQFPLICLISLPARLAFFVFTCFFLSSVRGNFFYGTWLRHKMKLPGFRFAFLSHHHGWWQEGKERKTKTATQCQSIKISFSIEKGEGEHYTGARMPIRTRGIKWNAEASIVAWLFKHVSGVFHFFFPSRSILIDAAPSSWTNGTWKETHKLWVSYAEGSGRGFVFSSHLRMKRMGKGRKKKSTSNFGVWAQLHTENLCSWQHWNVMSLFRVESVKLLAMEENSFLCLVLSCLWMLRETRRRSINDSLISYVHCCLFTFIMPFIPNKTCVSPFHVLPNSPLSRRTHAHKASSFWMNRFSDSNRRKMLRCDYIKVLACLSALLISLLMSFLFWFLFPFYFGSVSVFHRKINGFFNVPFFLCSPHLRVSRTKSGDPSGLIEKSRTERVESDWFFFPPIESRFYGCY